MKTGPQKAIAALVLAGATLLNEFGIVVDLEWQNMVTGILVSLFPLAVYFIRNSGT